MSSPARQRRNVWRGVKHKMVKRLAALLPRSGKITQGHGVSCSSKLVKGTAATFRDILLNFLSMSSLGMAVFYRHCLDATQKTPSTRVRDLLPLPMLPQWPSEICCGSLDVLVCKDTANVCIAALNCLHCGLKDADSSTGIAKKPTTAQAAAHQHICARVLRFLQRLEDQIGHGLPWEGAFGECEESVSAGAKYELLQSAAVDLPATAATCNPCSLIPEEMVHMVSAEHSIFPNGLTHGFVNNVISQQQRMQYVYLTIRELRCGKLCLRTEVKGVGGVFAVGKTFGRQRKVWDGSGVSDIAAAPPKPRRLANPSSFLDLEIDRGAEVFFSKRDAATFFDILQVPNSLQPWFGQPPVQVAELLDCGLCLEDISSFCKDVSLTGLHPDMMLYPVHAVWPMGFSWSSVVAQETTIAVCKKAGISESNILSLEHEPPASFDEVCFVATDDTVLIHKNREKGVSTLSDLDAAFEHCGVPRNSNKDVSLASCVTALGCELSNGPAKVEPSSAKLASVICRTLDVLHNGHASPKAFHALLGIWEWFMLLQRPLFSICASVYDFVRREPGTQPVAVPQAALNEMLVMLALAPLLSVGLDKQPLKFLTASDAAPQYGFGVTVCPCSSSEATDVCRLAERRGDYVRLDSGPGDLPEVARLGKPHYIKQTRERFKTVISCKARWSAHSGVLEAHAYLLALRWIARRACNHHHKAPLLVDAKVVVGAATKGRSSARALRRVLRAAAATTLAADILPRIVYIPSEANPADAPSRGKRHLYKLRPVRRSAGKSRSQLRLERCLARVASLRSLQ